MTPALEFERIVGQCPAGRHGNRILVHRDPPFFNRSPAFAVVTALPLGNIAAPAVFALLGATMLVADLRGLAGALFGAFASTDCWAAKVFLAAIDFPDARGFRVVVAVVSTGILVTLIAVESFAN
jgi:hypothetical protein